VKFVRFDLVQAVESSCAGIETGTTIVYATPVHPTQFQQHDKLDAEVNVRLRARERGRSQKGQGRAQAGSRKEGGKREGLAV